MGRGQRCCCGVTLSVTVLPGPGVPWGPRLQWPRSGASGLHGTSPGVGWDGGLVTGRGAERRGSTQAQQVLPEEPRPRVPWGREAPGRGGEPWTGSRHVYNARSSRLTAPSFHVRMVPALGPALMRGHGDQTAADRQTEVTPGPSGCSENTANRKSTASLLPAPRGVPGSGIGEAARTGAVGVAPCWLP